MDETKISLEYGKIPKVLLLGNGINRAFNFASWTDLLNHLKEREFSKEEDACLKEVPYPLCPVILTKDHIHSKLKKAALDFTELKAPEDEEQLLRKFLSLPFDAILTTNYTYELEKAIYDKFLCKVGRTNKYRKVAFMSNQRDTVKQLYTYYPGVVKTQSIWHIHGEASRPDTMVLGHYFYGKLLSKMQNHVSNLLRRYKGNTTRKQGMDVHSWIDFFMLSDVYIVAQGLDLSELDLWWLINCKKRHFADRKIFLYKPDIKLQEKLLADAYGIQVITSGLNKEDYAAYYSNLADDLNKHMS